MQKIEHCEPAASLIKKLGGLSVVAQITGKSVTQVQRWRLPKEKGGTGGAVPRWHAQKIFDAASASGIEVRSDELMTMGERE
jgi:hypothetical protein